MRRPGNWEEKVWRKLDKALQYRLSDRDYPPHGWVDVLVEVRRGIPTIPEGAEPEQVRRTSRSAGERLEPLEKVLRFLSPWVIPHERVGAVITRVRLDQIEAIAQREDVRRIKLMAPRELALHLRGPLVDVPADYPGWNKLDKALQDRLTDPDYGPDSWVDVLVEMRRGAPTIPEGAEPEQVRRTLRSAWERLQRFLNRLDSPRVVPLELVGAVSTRLRLDQIEAIAQREDVHRITLMVPRRMALLHQSGPLVGAPAAHDTHLTGDGILVAVFDTGIDDNHPALKGALIDRIDCTGDGPGNKTTLDASNGHGTHVAGIIASRDTKYRGIAPDCQLLDVKVMTAEGLGREDWVIEGCQRVVEQHVGPWKPSPREPPERQSDWRESSLPEAPEEPGTGLPIDSQTTLPSWEVPRRPVHVANMSLGLSEIGAGHTCGKGTKRCALCRAAEAMVRSGITVVAAVGNDGTTKRPDKNQIACPGNAPSVITVAASDLEDNIAPFSSRGPGCSSDPKPNLCAPGGLVEQHQAIVSCAPANGWATHQGTSMAAPHVAGACALILEGYPGLKPYDVKQILMHSAKELALSQTKQGQGRLDIAAALELAALVWEQHPWMGKHITHRKLVDDFLRTASALGSPDSWNDPCNWGIADSWLHGICDVLHNVHPADRGFVFALCLLLGHVESGLKPWSPHPGKLQVMHYYILQQGCLHAFRRVRRCAEIFARDYCSDQGVPHLAKDCGVGELLCHWLRLQHPWWLDGSWFPVVTVGSIVKEGIVALDKGDLEPAASLFGKASDKAASERVAKRLACWSQHVGFLKDVLEAFRTSETPDRIGKLLSALWVLRWVENQRLAERRGRVRLS
ncbi:MAG: S8 family serine peptidase [Armatimonadetes bacterium]|nr:S8 family serine peptidase [Armatimonadota bacterium]